MAFKPWQHSIVEMPRQQSMYYPRGEGIDGRPPTSCIKCGHGDFGAINRKDRDSVRYMCKKCKKSYHVPRPGAAESAVRTDGFITDNAVLGLSTRENVLKLYVDEGKVMAHNVVPARLSQNIRHVKMFTDDVLCCLKYGDVWGIDETVIEIRGSTQRQDAAIMEEFEKRHGHLRRDNPKTYDEEWEKARERSVRSASVSAKKWLTGAIDHKTRAIVHYIITDRRPGRREIYNLLKVAVNVAGIPRLLITDKYKAYSPAVKRLERALYGKGSVEHITIRAKNPSRLRMVGGPVVDGVRANNNIMEAAWSRIKRNMNTAYMERGAADDIIHYHVIHHNFIKPHFAHPAMRVERNGTRNEVNKTPVVAAGYPFWFANFEDLIRESLSYDKSFVFKLKDDMLARLTVGIHGNRTAVISAKQGTDMRTIIKIDKILQTECGFKLDYEKHRWSKDIESIPGMKAIRARNLSGKVPIQTFEICNKCGLVALTSQEVETMMGYRHSAGKWKTQPNCHSCRTAMSASPKRRTGPNRNKIGRTGGVVFGRQKTVTDYASN